MKRAVLQLACARSPRRGLCDLGYVGRTVDRFPRADYADVALPAAELPMFCFPRDVPLEFRHRDDAPMPQFFSFVLTDANGAKTHICCVQEWWQHPDGRFAPTPPDDASAAYAVYAPKCICVLSRWAFNSAFRGFLTQLYRVCLSESPMPLERYIATLMVEVPLPAPGGRALELFLTEGAAQPIVFQLPPTQAFPLLDVPFELLFRCLDVDNVLAVLALLLHERKVLLRSSHASLLTDVAEILCALLFPFQWSHCYVPRLPQALAGYLEAPGAFIIGMHMDKHRPAPTAKAAAGAGAMMRRTLRGLMRSASKQGVLPPLPADLPPDVYVVELDYNAVVDAPEDAARTRLPDKPAAELRRRLERAAERAGLQPGAGDLSTAGDAFDLAPRPDQGVAGMEEFSSLEVRDAALCFFVALLGDYQSKLRPPSLNAETGATSGWFDRDGFVADAPRDLQPFLRDFVQTQLFACWMQERTESGNPSLYFFDRCLLLHSREEGGDDDRAEGLLSERVQFMDQRRGSIRTSLAPIVVQGPTLAAEAARVRERHRKRQEAQQAPGIWPALDEELFAAQDTPSLRRLSQELRASVQVQEPPTLERDDQGLLQSHRSLRRLTDLNPLFRSVAEWRRCEQAGEDPTSWARHMATQVFGAWFMCLPALVSRTSHAHWVLAGFGALRRMRARRLEPDEAMYRAVLIACARAGPAFSDHAVKLLQEMCDSGIEASVLTYQQFTAALRAERPPAEGRQAHAVPADATWEALIAEGWTWAKADDAPVRPPPLPEGLLSDGVDLLWAQQPACQSPGCGYAMLDEQVMALWGTSDTDSCVRCPKCGEAFAPRLFVRRCREDVVRPRAQSHLDAREAALEAWRGEEPPQHRSSMELRLREVDDEELEARTEAALSELKTQDPEPVEGASTVGKEDDVAAALEADPSKRADVMRAARRSSLLRSGSLPQVLLEDLRESRRRASLDMPSLYGVRMAPPPPPPLAPPPPPPPLGAAPPVMAADEVVYSDTESDEEEEEQEQGDVDYLSPLVLRRLLEAELAKHGEEHLHRSYLRRQYPGLYWSLVWFCARLGLPLPLSLNTDEAHGVGRLDAGPQPSVVIGWREEDAADLLQTGGGALPRQSLSLNRVHAPLTAPPAVRAELHSVLQHLPLPVERGRSRAEAVRAVTAAIGAALKARRAHGGTDGFELLNTPVYVLLLRLVKTYQLDEYATVADATADVIVEPFFDVAFSGACAWLSEEQACLMDTLADRGPGSRALALRSVFGHVF